MSRWRRPTFGFKLRCGSVHYVGLRTSRSHRTIGAQNEASAARRWQHRSVFRRMPDAAAECPAIELHPAPLESRKATHCASRRSTYTGSRISNWGFEVASIGMGALPVWLLNSGLCVGEAKPYRGLSSQICCRQSRLQPCSVIDTGRTGLCYCHGPEQQSCEAIETEQHGDSTEMVSTHVSFSWQP
ncbi:hypothetical protein IE81DRAFT_18720 [Ceraceosorus guamensis]|uniref:Uncharacterized protein n=1 Tax=Ceraceosorus guamensis TaxID=1522189 RepID=A0A316W3D4_9BASI|nr:hypothetical protein IE81DRAFT_18720 [Ceraceosorus guamensis]PWN44386.1 hypothetical protein IE81DRAFT_18720 [Ceraceosorus guamensis]